MKELVPYIGVTGVRHVDEVEGLMWAYNDAKSPHVLHKLHLGVMMSYSRLWGIEQEFEWEGPLLHTSEDVVRLWHPDAYNCLHYADPHNRNLSMSLCKVIEMGGENLHALQLDLHRPNPKMVKAALVDSGRELEVILQVGKKAFREANGNPDAICRYIMPYQGIVHRVLLDQSMGNGVPMDTELLLRFAREISGFFPNLALVFAGGLGPNKMQPMKLIWGVFPNASCDAQGQISVDHDSRNPLSIDACGFYLEESFGLL